MESPLVMLLHAALIAVVLYLVMVYGLKQANRVALSRSTVLGLLVALYMVLFGHTMPPKINPDLGLFKK